ncbi:MAG: ATP-binding protein [Acetobacteraceae bacterium]
MAATGTLRPANPFAAGGALSSADGRGFFGRDDIFSFVRSALNATQRVPILLYGQRRIGKSSILRQLPRMLPDDLVCVYFDLQGKANQTLDQVLYGLARAIADALGMSRPERQEADEDGFRTGFLARVAREAGSLRRLVLLLDEFDVVDPRPGMASERFIPFLGEVVASNAQMGLILVMGRRTDELSETANAAILKDAVQMRIGRLEPPVVEALVRGLAGSAMRFSDAAVARVVALGAGNPFCTQVLCHVVWLRNLRDDATALIAPADVDAAVGQAIELGTNGMNWIYDGLDRPEQRLFLSALSEAADPLTGQRASLDAVQRLLRAKHIGISAGDLERASRELRAWDVIETDETGTHFVVPLLGAWVRKERPVVLLEREVRFASPRAWALYEAGLVCLERGDIDGATRDFRSALQENSVFLEAQLALAGALRKSERHDDRERAVEAWERVRELQPDLPATDLLDTLMASLEAARTGPLKASRFKRIQELDLEGTILPRAVRLLREQANRKLEIGRETTVQEAKALYEIIGDERAAASAAAVLKQHAWYNGVSGVSFLLWMGAIALAQFVPYAPVVAFAIMASAAFGVGTSWASVAEKSLKLSLRTMGLPFFAGGVVAGTLIWQFGGSIAWGTIAAGFAGLMNVVLAPTFEREEPPAPQPARQSEGLLVTVIGGMITGLESVRSRIESTTKTDR